jgi:hypothetical protein
VAGRWAIVDLAEATAERRLPATRSGECGMGRKLLDRWNTQPKNHEIS